MSNKQKKTFFQINITDVRGKKKSCEICKKDFSVLVKEHQCKRCKRAVCYACAQNRGLVYKINLKKNNQDEPHRQCSICHQESKRLQEFVKENRLVFGKDTISAKWLQNMNNKLKYNEITKEYFDYLNDPQFELKFNKEGTPEQITYKNYKVADQNMEKLFEECCLAFNYSLQEFFYHVISKTDPSTICIQIRNILKAFLNKHPEYGFGDELILVILFFLCFSSEPVAFCLMSYFYDLIYPRQLYYKYFKQSEYDSKRYVSLVIQLLETVFQIPNAQVAKVQAFLKNDFIRIFSTLTINALTFENSFLIIDNCIASCNFLDFLKSVTAICSLKMEDIHKYADVSFEKIQVVFLRNVEKQDILRQLHQFEQVDATAQQKLVNYFQQEEQKESIVLDEKYFQNKIMQSDQYKELQYRYEKKMEEIENLESKIFLKDQNYSDLLKENEILMNQFEELKQNYIQAQKEIFSLTNFTKQEEQAQPVEPTRIKYFESQIEELKLRNKLQLEEIEQLRGEKEQQVQENQKLAASLRETNKMLSDLAFEHQNLQYDLDSTMGRSRASTRSRQQEVTKLSYDILEQKVSKLETALEQAQQQLEQNILDQSEAKMTLIRIKRQQQEANHVQNTLNLELELTKEQLQKEKERHQQSIYMYQEQLNIQYKKMFESLEVAYKRNEELVNDNKRITQEDAQIREKMIETSKVSKILQEENEKLRIENEELNKIAQMAKKSDEENPLFEYKVLLQEEDQNRKALIQSLFDKANDYLQEIQFRSIDQLLKREYITQLQKKNKILQKDLEDQEKAMKILHSKVEKILDGEQQSLKTSKIQYQQSIKSQQIEVVTQNQECIIM
ncbi:hypothetical protein pb186bvf_011193 [Paramecium bursaria]